VIWFVGGFAALIALTILLRALANADPVKLVRGIKWVGLATAGIAGMVFMIRGSVGPALLAFGAAGAIRASLWRPGAGGGSTASSDVETEWLRMSLDHGTGETSGLVLKGRHAGARLHELDEDALLDLLGELRIGDAQSALLLEAYLRRVHPDIEERMAAGQGAAPGAAAMDRDEALEVLGLEADADEDAIREAHKRLMQQLHPDRGGTDYLAAKINLARDLLLKR
jgi:hypothetical protein